MDGRIVTHKPAIAAREDRTDRRPRANAARTVAAGLVPVTPIGPPKGSMAKKPEPARVFLPPAAPAVQSVVPKMGGEVREADAPVPDAPVESETRRMWRRIAAVPWVRPVDGRAKVAQTVAGGPAATELCDVDVAPIDEGTSEELVPVEADTVRAVDRDACVDRDVELEVRAGAPTVATVRYHQRARLRKDWEEGLQWGTITVDLPRGIAFEPGVPVELVLVFDEAAKCPATVREAARGHALLDVAMDPDVYLQLSNLLDGG